MSKKRENKGKPVFDFDNFKEIIELIPKIRKTINLGMMRELQKPKQEKKILKMDRSFIREVSTLLQGKWTADILFFINFLKNPYYNEIKKALPEINTRTLTNRLLFLNEKGIIARKIHDTRPVRVSYSLTRFGEGLISLYIPILLYVALEYEKNNK